LTGLSECHAENHGQRRANGTGIYCGTLHR